MFAWLRFAPGGKPALVVCNFTPMPRHGYRIGVPQAGLWREIISTDAGVYGGSDLGNAGGVHASDEPCGDFPCSVWLTLPPLATLILTGE